MRGIILEINKRSMIVLTHDNQYIKVKTGKQIYGIGDEIQFPAPDRRPVWHIPFMKPVLAGAALCIVLASIFPMLRSEPQTLPIEAYVSVDINPSLEVGIDSKLNVNSIHPFNEDGSKVVSQISNWKGESLQKVVDAIIQISDKDGFLRGDRHVLISTNVVDEHSSFANSIDASVKQMADKEESTQHVTIKTMKGSTSIRTTSESLGVSEGKYMLYEDAKQRGIHVSLQHVRETSISDLDRELSQAASDETSEDTKQTSPLKEHVVNQQNIVKNATIGEGKPSDSSFEVQQSATNGEKGHREEEHSKDNNQEVNKIGITPTQKPSNSVNPRSNDDNRSEKNQNTMHSDHDDENHAKDSR